MKPIKTLLPTLSFITLIAFSGNSLAGSCSKEDVDHYLKSGFTHDQVVKLCSDPATAQSSGNLYQSISSPNRSIPAPAAPTYQPGQHTYPVTNTQRRSSEDQVYFETVIEGSPVTLTNDKLVFDRRECAVYGDLDMTHIRDKACVKTRTTIHLKGLEIVRATKGILLIREQELLVKGNITREYLSTTGLNKYKIAAVNKQLPTQPSQLNIPVKKGIDPKIVAGKLKKYQ